MDDLLKILSAIVNVFWLHCVCHFVFVNKEIPVKIFIDLILGELPVNFLECVEIQVRKKSKR